jgi:hypothetical protein
MKIPGGKLSRWEVRREVEALGSRIIPVFLKLAFRWSSVQWAAAYVGFTAFELRFAGESIS